MSRAARGRGARRGGLFGRGRRGGLALVIASAAVVTAFLCVSAGGAAAAEGCEWTPHKVRVVKHVKRHGKLVKLVRNRVKWSCEPVPTASPAPTPTPPVAVPPTVPTPIPGPTPPEEEPSNPHYLGAKSSEYKFEAAGPSLEVEAGADTIELINTGQDAHSLSLERVGGGEPIFSIEPKGPGEHKRGNVTLEPGEYVIYCDLGDHRTVHHMEAKLVVRP